MRVIYCQKMRFPAQSAHAIHTAMTVANLALAGAEVIFFPGASGGTSVLDDFFNGLGFDLGELSSPPAGRLDVRRIPCNNKGLYGILFRLALLKAMRRPEASVCYASSIKEAAMALSLRKCMGISAARLPVVLELHHIISSLKSGWEAAKLRKLEEEVFRNADLVVFISEELKRTALEILPEPRDCVVSHLGFNERNIKALPAPQKDGESGVNVVYLGSLQPGKGVESLIEALALLPAGYRLTILGGRPEECLNDLKKQARTLGLTDRIDFAGQVRHSELTNHLASCDIFTIPINTVTDFFCPIKMYEAVGFALPIAATPAPSLKEVLVDGKNAVFTRGFGAEPMAEALLRLGEDPALRLEMRTENAALAKAMRSSSRSDNLVRTLADKFPQLSA